MSDNFCHNNMSYSQYPDKIVKNLTKNLENTLLIVILFMSVSISEAERFLISF